jgi:hypothetical protein
LRSSHCYASRSLKWMLTVSPSCLPIRWRRSALMGSLWVPSPSGMKELRNGWPSTLPATLTSPADAEEIGAPVRHDVGPSTLGGTLVQGGGEGLSERHAGRQRLARLRPEDAPVLASARPDRQPMARCSTSAWPVTQDVGAPRPIDDQPVAPAGRRSPGLHDLGVDH